jgi:membrane-associated phospholipid phosphatase
VLAEGHIIPRDQWGHLESYPSGHMAITAALAVAAGLVFPRLRLLLWTWVVAVAFTRVMFGAHFPLDTLAGIVLGAVVARGMYSLFLEVGLLERRRSAPAERWDGARLGRPA